MQPIRISGITDDDIEYVTIDSEHTARFYYDADDWYLLDIIAYIDTNDEVIMNKPSQYLINHAWQKLRPYLQAKRESEI